MNDDDDEIICSLESIFEDNSRTNNQSTNLTISNTDGKFITNAEYKIFLDQTVELHRLKDKVSRMEAMEQSLKANIIRMQSVLKEKTNELKEFQHLLNFYERERKKTNR